MSKKNIKQIINSEKQQIMPGMFINSPFPTEELKQVDPFVLLHHFGPNEVNKAKSFSFEPHPHRGFEAVTFLFEGEFEHRDSSGGFGKLSGGDVQWMTAGSGIIHEEKQPDDFIDKGGIVHGIQLWINLPKDVKMSPPKYQDIRKADIPEIKEKNSKLRIIAGSFNGLTGPAKTFTPMLVIHGIINNGNNNIEIPENYNSLIYVTKGSITVNGVYVSKSQMALMSNDGTTINISSESGSEFLLLSGNPINEPVVQYGPFVMNTMGEIKQAFIDYRNGSMGKI
ncbi:MAG TPA: pirin family protein [Ignavibacteria bacterium]|nr:pirin family protein [Ignavibacteria bacterium]